MRIWKGTWVLRGEFDVEDVLGEDAEKVALAHAGVPNQQHLQQVVVLVPALFPRLPLPAPTLSPPCSHSAASPEFFLNIIFLHMNCKYNT